MNRRSYAPSRSPGALYQRGVVLDNITLVPASLLPFKARWDQFTHTLPAGEALLVIPPGDTPLHQTLRAIVPHLRAQGRHVTAVHAERFS